MFIVCSLDECFMRSMLPAHIAPNIVLSIQSASAGPKSTVLQWFNLLSNGYLRLQKHLFAMLVCICTQMLAAWHPCHP